MGKAVLYETMTVALSTWPFMRKFVSFSGIGALATILQYAILGLLVELANVNPVLSSALGYSLSALFNYYCNYHFTFRSVVTHRQALPRFFAISLSGLLLNTGFMVLFNHTAKWHYMLSQMAATMLVLLWNFLGNLLFSFRVISTESHSVRTEQRKEMSS